MLALINNGEFIQIIREGGRLDLEGSVIMPTLEGELFGGYYLKKIQPADPAPEGKRITSTEVEMIGGEPKWVNTLENISYSELEVDAERDRRIEGGFIFNGKKYQTRAEDRENITGASVAALAAISAGAQQGDFRWQGGDTDFSWIAEDNSLTLMDAQTMFAFGQAAMAHKQTLIFAARALKDLPEIPEDYTDDKYWIL